VLICRSYDQKAKSLFFSGHCVYCAVVMCSLFCVHCFDVVSGASGKASGL